MGTRGFICFVVNGVEKTAYVHYDSYPAGLGCDVLEWLREAVEDRTELRRRLADLRVVDPASRATDEDVQRLRRFADESVSTRDLHEWYVLLRETQGDPALILEAGVIEDASKFPYDSLYAEWGYVVNVDEELFEMYRGFQREPHSEGRFADGVAPPHFGGPYHPVRLVASWSFDALPTANDLIEAGNDVLERRVGR